MKFLRSPSHKSKRESSTDDGEPVAKRQRKQFVQFPAFKEPSIPAGEDEHSYKRNQKMLLSQERKLNPDKHTVSVLMQRTFAFRRRDLLKNSYPITEVLKMYPSLMRIDQVHI